MNCTSLTGKTYETRKRTTPRNHQADLKARDHYNNRASVRPYQIWLTEDGGVTFSPVHISRETGQRVW